MFSQYGLCPTTYIKYFVEKRLPKVFFYDSFGFMGYHWVGLKVKKMCCIREARHPAPFLC